MTFFNRTYIPNMPIVSFEKVKFNQQGLLPGNQEKFFHTTRLCLPKRLYGHSGCQNHKVELEET